MPKHRAIVTDGYFSCACNEKRLWIIDIMGNMLMEPMCCGGDGKLPPVPPEWNPPTSPPEASPPTEGRRIKVTSSSYECHGGADDDVLSSPKKQKAALEAFGCGDFSESRRLINESETSADHSLHVDLASCCINMGVDEGRNGNYDEALRLLKQALRIWAGPATTEPPLPSEAVAPWESMPASMDVAKIYDNIGKVYYEQCHYSKAKEAFRQALAVYRKALAYDAAAESSPFVKDAKKNIAEMDELLKVSEEHIPSDNPPTTPKVGRVKTRKRRSMHRV